MPEVTVACVKSTQTTSCVHLLKAVILLYNTLNKFIIKLKF